MLRLADCYPESIVEQNGFKVLLGYGCILGTTIEEILELAALSQELFHMMPTSKWLEEGSLMLNIQHFVQHNYQKQDGDPPLEHMYWDVLLLKRLKEVSHLDTEVGYHAQSPHAIRIIALLASLGDSQEMTTKGFGGRAR